jgi:hypothetical protein
VRLDPELRASDEQRERAAAEIRDHFAAGRLDDEELAERLAAAYRARTQGELHALRADLPALPPAPHQARAELAERRSRLQRQVIQETGGGLGVFVLCTAIWAATGARRSGAGSRSAPARAGALRPYAASTATSAMTASSRRGERMSSAVATAAASASTAPTHSASWNPST